MFWRKKSDPNPFGVPLGDLVTMLQPTSIKARLEGSALIAQHEHYATRIEVAAPETGLSGSGKIRAVVRMITDLPTQILELYKEPEARIAMARSLNVFAALSAVSLDRDRAYIGSRLTLYDNDDEEAWRTLHLPLLMFTTICGTEAILGGVRRAFTKEGPRRGASAWTNEDLQQVEHYLSRLCVCTTDGFELTAQFGLSAEPVSAAASERRALFQQVADQPHPELGGGLLCLLHMPHEVGDERRLEQVCIQLNNMDIATQELPPHFGAWCAGWQSNNPAYVSFFPNVLHRVSGIAFAAAVWARKRAQWARVVLDKELGL